MQSDAASKILAFSAIVEIGTGLVLLAAPAIVIRLLLGVEAATTELALGRCFGVALLALGTACLPRGERVASDSPACRGMLVYNGLIALYLAFLGTAGHLGGVFLWPAVALHTVVAVMLYRRSHEGVV